MRRTYDRFEQAGRLTCFGLAPGSGQTGAISSGRPVRLAEGAHHWRDDAPWPPGCAVRLGHGGAAGVDGETVRGHRGAWRWTGGCEPWHGPRRGQPWSPPPKPPSRTDALLRRTRVDSLCERACQGAGGPLFRGFFVESTAVIAVNDACSPPKRAPGDSAAAASAEQRQDQRRGRSASVDSRASTRPVQPASILPRSDDEHPNARGDGTRARSPDHRPHGNSNPALGGCPARTGVVRDAISALESRFSGRGAA